MPSTTMRSRLYADRVHGSHPLFTGCPRVCVFVILKKQSGQEGRLHVDVPCTLGERIRLL